MCKARQGDAICQRITRGLLSLRLSLQMRCCCGAARNFSLPLPFPFLPALCPQGWQRLQFFVLLASSPPVLPIFSVPPSISFADLFCRGDLDTQKHSVSHCLGDALKTMVELTFIWLSGLLCLAHYVRYSNHHNSLLVLVIFVTGKLIFRAFFWFPCNHT